MRPLNSSGIGRPAPNLEPIEAGSDHSLVQAILDAAGASPVEFRQILRSARLIDSLLTSTRVLWLVVISIPAQATRLLAQHMLWDRRTPAVNKTFGGICPLRV